ncbi:CTR1 suppressor protein [Sporormia fimetaria CBS 119925]|uniref:CTR1 suppressor protein n=1 Tax=Sporormia fimetaria CBS 119925 TaxID=1340428 RepID=A0A6A6VJW2_9PLEO|nr:CTR1 suppressor protein [Sporormia fimetaria CBS 119925]
MGKKDTGLMNRYAYDAFLWTFSILVELFFREVHPRSSWKIPKEGPVLFVCAPHANQFVDPLILMRCVKKESDRRIHFLVAEKSMKRKFIGTMAGMTGAVSVGRAMDSMKPAEGKIYLPDPVNDPCLVRGVGTNFEEKNFQVGGTLYLPKVNETSANAEIAEILGPEEIRLKRPFRGGIPMQQMTGRTDMTKDGRFTNGAEKKSGPAQDFEGTDFLVAPKLNQKEVYDKVHAVLHAGGSVGIFPEGGSHDRPDLLPLKAGVAIMALGTVAEKRDCNLKIIPVGMNYFHAHKFRSRAVIEFGNALDVPLDLVDKYVAGERREAIGSMLEKVREALLSVTVTAPDYDTLMLIQAVRRLYNPKGKRLPLPWVIELNRRLIKGYERYKDDERIIDLKKSVLDYNRRLFAVGIRDHQVKYAKRRFVTVFFTFWYRLLKLCALSILVIPGTALFSFVFIFTKVISIKKSREALAASNVKIHARDVMATWKLLVALVVAPVSYAFHIVWITTLYYYNNCFGYAPPGIPLKALIIAQMIIYPIITYAALRFGEVGMDIAKSLWPLLKLMSPTSGNELVRLQATREELVNRVNSIINTLGPEMFDDFDSKRIIKEPWTQSPPTSPGGPLQNRRFRPLSPGAANDIARNESFEDLSNQDFFSTRPSTPRKHSKSGSHGGFHVEGFTALDAGAQLEEVSKKIRGIMRERGRKRSHMGETGGDGYVSGSEGESEGEGGMVMAKKDR